MFEVRNLTLGYRGKSILRDVSFLVSPGEIVSIVGANGVGKTTLMRSLATLLVPETGSVLLDGCDAFADTLRYRRQIGYLPERPALYEDMTVKEYLTYRACLKGELSKRVRRRVTEAAEMCGLSPVLRHAIRTLSFGLKKRVALADAILLRPRVLLLDDFLSGLDVEMRESSAAILSEAAAFSSVIVTGHELNDLVSWTTRFLVLRDGTLAETLSAAGGTKEDLLARLRDAWKGGAS